MRMFRSVSVLLALTLVLGLLLVSCGGDETDGEAESTVYYTVTFDPNNGQEKDVRQVAAGGKIARPDDPEWEGYFFGEWRNGTIEWDFENGTVREDMTLKATWFDAENYFAWELTEDGSGAVITKLKKERAELRVPDTIKGHPVVAIGDGVFADQTVEKMIKIVLPESVCAVGERAFANCSDIEIVVEGTLTALGAEAFSGCNGLSAVTLGEGVTRIGADSFRDCTALKSISLPKSVTVIEENAFDSCTSLVWVMLYSTTKSVEDGAFHNCSSLKVLYFHGAEAELDTLLEEGLAPQNEVFDGEEFRYYLYAEQAPTADTVYDGYWYLDKGRIKTWEN